MNPNMEDHFEETNQLNYFALDVDMMDYDFETCNTSNCFDFSEDDIRRFSRGIKLVMNHTNLPLNRETEWGAFHRYSDRILFMHMLKYEVIRHMGIYSKYVSKL